jgi:3-hydroxyisobutyrate dehydrogenase
VIEMPGSVAMAGPLAFIGAGKMGGGMARRLAGAGYTVVVYDPDPAAVTSCREAGALSAESAGDAVKEARVVFTSLPLPEDVLGLYEGPSSILESLRPGAVCVDVSTIDPITARRVSDLLGGRGLGFVSCPVGKGPAQAAEGSVPLFAGGPAELVEELRPLLAHLGNPLYYMGDVEASTTFKIISNVIGMANLAVLAEGYVLARRAGIEDEVFAAALKDTGAASYQMDLRLPWIMAGDHAPRFATRLAVKDVRLAVDCAARWAVPVPLGAAVLQQLASATAHGYGEEDVTAMVKTLSLDGSAARE